MRRSRRTALAISAGTDVAPGVPRRSSAAPRGGARTSTGPGGERRAGDRRLHAVGTRLLHSNALVNIWEVALDPGQEHHWHHHRYPYLVVTVEPGRACITDKATGRRMIVDGAAGSVLFDPGGALHKIGNAGHTRILDQLIELKHTPFGVRPPRVRTRPRRRVRLAGAAPRRRRGARRDRQRGAAGRG